jgi:hypothetical protein
MFILKKMSNNIFFVLLSQAAERARYRADQSAGFPKETAGVGLILAVKVLDAAGQIQLRQE